jgi:predicted transglutaminase-like cysteine proteinase
MIAQIVVLLALMAVAFAQTYPQVFVEVYYEALCPGSFLLFCTRFKSDCTVRCDRLPGFRHWAAFQSLGHP